ncbi:MAG: hypothetical protein ACKV2Q_07785 [Planctomycetaceae bacterium]
MAGTLDARMSFRLAIIVAGMLLADDRRTASSWFMALLRSWKLERVVWFVVDGAYAARPFLDAVLAEGAVVVSLTRQPNYSPMHKAVDG